ncbi:polysaccharide pyruvyl transferase family protein [Sphingobium sp.]|uniref:polysaccharide pyruvyl transferase family protein n=1 Tax=Sphingobium sp. TaxID=1912891 RepID=UPI003B3AB123
MPGETNLELIARLQGQIHDCIGRYIGDAPIAVVDFPDIRNCGDSAIWVGEMAYLRDRFGKRPDFAARYHDYSPERLKRAAPEGPIFIHGGGNFGDVWPGHQDFRESVLDSFPDRQVIQFPQSIKYHSDARADQTARAIERHKGFILLVRDQESLEFAQARFQCETYLCPDMAFCIGPLARRSPIDTPVLAMLRADAEKAGEQDLSAYPALPVEDWITEDASQVKRAKILGALSAYAAFSPGDALFRKLDAAANTRLDRGVRQISRAQAIVTDRLHVHIISLLLGIPHAVLDNSYGKIRRFMNAFSGTTDLAYRPSSFDDAMAWATDVARPRQAA